jgi:hypothetical protein
MHTGPPAATIPSEVEASLAEPPLPKALAMLAARLHERHPSASAAMVRRSIDDAVRAFSEVRVRVYLPILIERSASEALRLAPSRDPRSKEDW